MSDDIIEINDTNFEEIMQNNNFVLVDFWAPWCAPCTALMPHIKKLAEDRKSIRVCKLNIDEVQDIASSYNVRSIPTLIIFKDKKEVARKIGGCDFDALAKWVDDEIKKINK